MSKNTKYVSDLSKFVVGYLNTYPELRTKQQKLRNTWWDTDTDTYQEELKMDGKNAVKLDGYAYFSYHNPKKDS